MTCFEREICTRDLQRSNKFYECHSSTRKYKRNQLLHYVFGSDFKSEGKIRKMSHLKKTLVKNICGYILKHITTRFYQWVSNGYLGI